MRNAETMNRDPEYLAFRKVRENENRAVRMQRIKDRLLTRPGAVRSLNGVVPDEDFDTFLQGAGW